MTYDARDRDPDGAPQLPTLGDSGPPRITPALIERHKARARQMQAEAIHRLARGAMAACARRFRRGSVAAGRRHGRLADHYG